ncbi:MAG: non-homologous end-joining DNA ligase [Solirubrobacterales bacterium]
MAKQSQSRQVDVDGHRLELTNLDKVLWPDPGFTKGEMIDYYARVADVLLPHLQGRPLTLKRYPNGVAEKFFYEKRCPKHRPDWVNTVPIWSGRNEGEIDYCVCDDRATLIWVAQLASLELHPSLSRAKEIERPTVLAFDLDPGPPATILECCTVGLRLRDLFADLGLESFPKTSGSKGLQVYVPLNVKVTYEDTKPFAHAVAQVLERADPDLIVSRMAKNLRKDKVLVDWSQNDEHKTTVSVYSLRAKEHPTASTPVEWKEVERALKREDPDVLRFEAKDVLKRVEKHGDLFEPVLKLKQRLPDLKAATESD